MENGLDELIAANDPVGDFGPEILTALSALREEILDMSTITTLDRSRSTSRRRRVIAGLGVALALVAGAAGAAAAGGLFARTGENASGTGEDGVGEIIDVGAPEALEVIDELDSDIPLPPGGSWDDTAAMLADDPSLMAESVLRNTMSWNAACQWATSWLDAHAADDVDAMALAQRTLDQIPSWPALVDNNPDGGVRQMWQTVADAAHAGDAAAVRDAGYTVNCSDSSH
jgi:hypothetical protein